MPLVDLRDTRALPLWPRLEAGAATTAVNAAGAGPVLAALADWQTQGDALRAAQDGGAQVGAWLAPEQDAADLAAALGGHLHRLPAIGLLLPVFGDGRAFSTAHRLRLRHGYGGPLWALGKPLAEQAGALLRVGFTALELADGFDPALLRTIVGRYGAVYQPAVDGQAPVWALRGQDRPATGRAAQ